MVKSKRLGKLSLIAGVALAVILLFAIVSMNSANAEDFLSTERTFQADRTGICTLPIIS